MDILRPPTIWLNGICYRQNTVVAAGREEYMEEEPYEEEYHGVPGEEEDLYADEVCDAFSHIEQTQNGFKTTMEMIPGAYFKYIIGTKGQTLRRIEQETRTQIKIPPRGREGDVVIIGNDKKGVSSARSRIQILVESGRQKQPFTHFLSYPINSQAMQEAFLNFKEEVLKQCHGERGIDTTIFQNPCKLHLTIGTLALMNDKEIARAKDILQECEDELIRPILHGSPLKAHVKGLEYMNDDPSAVDVLYAKIQLEDGSDRLQMLTDRLVDKFSASGLMQREFERVKLHITVINSLMRKEERGTMQQQQRRNEPKPLLKNRESFDANNVLKHFGEYDFGSYHINTVHLSQRLNTGSDGYYGCVVALSL